MIHHNTSITDTHRITYLQIFVSGKAKYLIHAYSCDPSYYQTALNELINHFGDRTIVVNAFINKLENWQINHQNKLCFIAFSSFLKRLVQAFQYLGFIADPQSTTLLKKANEKVPHNLILKWTEHCLTEFRSDPSLADFQQWSELQAQVYVKVNQENPIRNTSPNSKKLGSSDFNAGTAYRNYTSQLNSLVVNQERNQKHQLQQSLQPQSTNSSPKSFNAYRSCEKSKSNHSLAVCPEYQLCPPGERYSIVSRNSLCTDCLSNKHHKQACASAKRCQVCSGFHHTTLHEPAKQIKRPTSASSTENAQKHHPTLLSNNKAAVENTINNFQTKNLQNKNSNSRYGQSFNGQNQTKPQRRNLNGSSTNQSFSFNQSPDAPKNWYEQLQLIPVSFLKGNKAFDTNALIDPVSQCSFFFWVPFQNTLSFVENLNKQFLFSSITLKIT